LRLLILRILQLQQRRTSEGDGGGVDTSRNNPLTIVTGQFQMTASHQVGKRFRQTVTDGPHSPQVADAAERTPLAIPHMASKDSCRSCSGPESS
jgi:hypothetical protein